MNNKIVILGAGESGTGAAILAKKKGYDVFVSDKSAIKDKYKKVLSNHAIRWEEGQHTEAEILPAQEIIKSPGIPDTVPLVKSLREKGTPVVSEIEFAARHTDAQMICITGSNGKTTTTMLTYDMLKSNGLRVGLAGNVGQSLAWQVAEKDFDYYVVELSSFQLDGMFEFKAHIAILLNISADHLDRYNYDFNLYAESKLRIIRNMTASDHIIYWKDDPEIAKRIAEKQPAAQLHPFTLTYGEAQPKGRYAAKMIAEKQFIITHQTDPLVMSIHDLALQGKHNLANSMAAGIAGSLLQLRKENVRESLTSFENVEHRLEFVAKINDVTYTNDSKATNVNSTWYALESREHPVIWIAGGTDKGNDYTDLLPLAKQNVKALICLGADNAKLKAAFENTIDVILETKDMKEAVQMAYDLAHAEDCVLLSPACASFDLFENYEDRGQQFKKAVKGL